MLRAKHFRNVLLDLPIQSRQLRHFWLHLLNSFRLTRDTPLFRSWHYQCLCFVSAFFSLTFRGFQRILTFYLSNIPLQCLYRRMFLIDTENVNVLSGRDERFHFLDPVQTYDVANSHTRASLATLTALTNVKSKACVLVLTQEKAVLLVLVVCDSVGRHLQCTDSILKLTGSRSWRTSTPPSPHQPKPLHNVISPSPRLFQLSIYKNVNHPFLEYDYQDRASRN